MKVNPVPEGFHTITPYFAVKGVPKLIEFLQAAFGARVDESHTRPDGAIANAEMTVGTSKVMVGELRGDGPGMPAMLYMYVDDVDSVYRQAIKAGGKSVLEPIDMFYGDRSGAVEDPAGNQWWIATRKENLTSAEIERRSLTQK